MADSNYPYWKNEFDHEMKGLEVWYRENHHHENDTADGYRVFMILCNNNSDKPRMEVLQSLKDATEEKPLMIGSDSFWCEKTDWTK